MLDDVPLWTVRLERFAGMLVDRDNRSVIEAGLPEAPGLPTGSDADSYRSYCVIS